MSEPVWIDAEAVERLLPFPDAVDALEEALRGGLDPEADPARSAIEADAGQLLLMPSRWQGAVGVKLASVAAANPARGLPRIQGVYVLFDAETLATRALVDGIGLTSLRTAAVSALAVRHLARPDARRLVVYGSGPQAWSHVQALRAIRPIDQLGVVARDRGRRDAFVERCRAAGVSAEVPEGDASEALGAADVVCCCTTAREPLFDGSLVSPGATVVAIGSHEPEAREVDERLAGRSTVVVEARSAALREAGDVIQAIAAGVLEAGSLVTLGELVCGRVGLSEDRPRLFKSTGMAWEDIVVASALVERAAPSGGGGAFGRAERQG
jgi:ornithine cyclodeaminase/alanine dehydrogenase-like protein (mu-crystallin family)